MSKYTKGNWINGYGNGITGPTTPTTTGPTVEESLAWGKYMDEGIKGKYPVCKHTVVSCGGQTIAIVPTIYPEGEANAQLIAAAPDLLKTCKFALELVAGQRIYYDSFLPQLELEKKLAEDYRKSEKQLETVIAKAEKN